MPLDPALARQFAEEFDQYGNPRGSIWLVGPEEAGVETLADFERRLGAWEKLGKSPVVDAFEFHELIGERALFEGDRRKTQTTWRRLILLLLAAQGKEPSLDAVWQYQRARLGRNGSDEWWTELYPLPSHSEGHWVYDELAAHPGLQFMAERDTCKAYCRPFKVSRLKAALETGPRPRAVVFYGRGVRNEHADAWDDVAGTPVRADIGTGAWHAVKDGTLFVSAHHPSAKWGSAYWIGTGNRMAELLVAL